MATGDLTGSRIFSGGYQINRVYHKNTMIYDYVLKEVQVGNIMTIQPSTITQSSQYLNEWDSFTNYGSPGTSRNLETAHFINNQKIGAGFNQRTEVIKAPVNNIYYRGTKSDSTHNYVWTTVSNRGSGEGYTSRFQAKFSGNNYTSYTDVVTAFRVRGSSKLTSINGRIRYKQVGRNTVTGFNYSIVGDSSNVDSEGNLLFTLINAPSNSDGYNFGERVDIYFNHYVASVYDVKVFISKTSGGGSSGGSRPTYTVKSGDSLWGISQAHGLTLNELLALNGRTETWTIHPGDKLFVG